MGLMREFGAGLRAVTSGTAIPPWDDYWYTRPGWESAAGMNVTPESAMQLAAVFSCVRVVSETLASLPFIIYRRRPDGGKERAVDHPLYRVLHDSPNIWQTSMEFVEMMQGHLELRGNAFAHIVPGPRGAIDQLIPLHPDLVQVYRIPNGRLKYQVRSRFTAEVNWYTQDEIFHLRGLSSDGLVGLSTIAVQRETIGTGLGMQDYGGRFFANDSKPSFVLEHPGRFKDDAARDKFRDSIQRSQTEGNRHKVLLLESGMKASQLGLTNKDSQFLEASGAKSVEIAGIFRVPPHKIGILDRATHSNIEHQNIEFVIDTMRPRAVRWERRVNIDLIDPLNEALGDDCFGEFLLDGLLRGDLKSRMDSYAVARQWGLINANGVAQLENWEPIAEEDGGDDYWRPVNMAVIGAPIQPGLLPGAPIESEPEPKDTQPDAPPAPQQDQPADDEGNDAPAKKKKAAQSERLLGLFAGEAAGRVIRKEVAALRKSLSRSPEGFDAEAQAFYSTHADLVAQTMCISQDAARRYISGHLQMLGDAAEPADKSCVLDWIEDTGAQELARMALGQRRPALEGANR
jgi:HK97 family phage portal protein